MNEQTEQQASQAIIQEKIIIQEHTTTEEQTTTEEHATTEEQGNIQEKAITEELATTETNDSAEEKLMDFNSIFKKNKQMSRPKKQIEEKKEKVLITNVVPCNLTITQEEMKIRRCLDLRRWYSLSRPQYSRSCGISSVVTVWNYLFSTLGVGQLPPVSQEDAIVQLSLAKQEGPHFNDVEFGTFSGNMSLITWFKNLCRLYKVKGRSYYLWKVAGKNATPGIDRDVALDKLKSGLRTDHCSYIYHAYDHYFCPVGYEVTPNKGFEAYQQTIDQDAAETWMIIAEPAKPCPFFTVRKWKDIAQDIELIYPQYTNIRKMEEGIKEYKKPDIDCSSQHCIMAFERVDPIKKKDTGAKISQQQSQEPDEPLDSESDLQTQLNEQKQELRKQNEKLNNLEKQFEEFRVQKTSN